MSQVSQRQLGTKRLKASNLIYTSNIYILAALRTISIGLKISQWRYRVALPIIRALIRSEELGQEWKIPVMCTKAIPFV